MKPYAPALLLVAALSGCGSRVPDTAAPVIELGSRALCNAYAGLPAGWGQDAHAGMVRLAGGRAEMGSARGYADELPVTQAELPAFWIDRTEVTNAQFGAFVAATGYVTSAEKGGGAAVFQQPPVDKPVAEGSWWHLVDGATWRHPQGPASAAPAPNDPVVDVSYADALAYAKWLGRTLPSERQWEYAAKAGRDNAASDQALRDADGRPRANFWQGVFPLKNTDEDGFAGVAPVGCFAANPFGLHDAVGNVWEWTTDAYTGDHAGDLTRSAGAPRRVIKGGSYLCSADYCVRARASSRQPQEEDLPAAHVGFRTIAPA